MNSPPMVFIRTLFDSVWSLFDLHWPGFDFSIGVVFLGIVFAVISLKIVAILFNGSIGSDFSSVLRSAGRAGGNNSNIKVSADRKGDEK